MQQDVGVTGASVCLQRARVQLSPMFWQFGYHTCLPGARRGCAGAARSPAAATASMSTRAGCCPLAWRCNLDYVSMQLCLLAKDGHVKRLNLSLSQRGHQSQEETDAHVGRVRNRRRPRDACSMHPGATCRWRLATASTGLTVKNDISPVEPGYPGRVHIV